MLLFLVTIINIDSDLEDRIDAAEFSKLLSQRYLSENRKYVPIWSRDGQLLYFIPAKQVESPENLQYHTKNGSQKNTKTV